MRPLPRPARAASLALAAALALAPAPAPAGPTGGDAGGPAPAVPPQIERLWARGEEARARGDLDGALAAHAEALALDEGLARSWNYLGGARFARGDFAAALEAFLRAAALDPRDPRAHNNAGSAAERLGDYAAAEGHYVKAVLAEPRLAAAHRNLGVLYAYRLGRPGEARRAWLRYLELAPESPDAEAVRAELERLPRGGAAPAR